jgi:hypothetical protein
LENVDSSSNSAIRQVTTNLGAPISWETIATNAAASSGIIEFVDPAATNIPARYYRTVVP